MKISNYKFDPSKFRKARNDKGLSLNRLSSELFAMGKEISMQTLHHWEVGRSQPKAVDLYFLSKFLERPVSYFFKKA